MDTENTDPAGQDPGASDSPGNGRTIPKSNDGIRTTWTSEKSNFEPEEDAPAQAGETENAGDPEGDA
jgi:hypothetical protein